MRLLSCTAAVAALVQVAKDALPEDTSAPRAAA